MGVWRTGVWSEGFQEEQTAWAERKWQRRECSRQRPARTKVGTGWVPSRSWEQPLSMHDSLGGRGQALGGPGGFANELRGTSFWRVQSSKKGVARDWKAWSSVSWWGMGGFQFPIWGMHLVWKSKFRIKILYLISIKRRTVTFVIQSKFWLEARN